MNGSRWHLGDEALVVPHLEVVDLTEHVDVAGHARGLAQPRVDDDAALDVDLRRLAVVVDPVEELEPRGCVDGTGQFSSSASQTGIG